MSIGKIIKELRKEKNLTQKELSELTKLAQSSICEWEKENYEPTATSIKILAAFFNVNTDYLLELSEEEKIIKTKAQRMLKAFNLLSEDEKDKIIEDCEYFANKNTKISNYKNNNA